MIGNMDEEPLFHGMMVVNNPLIRPFSWGGGGVALRGHPQIRISVILVFE